MCSVLIVFGILSITSGMVNSYGCNRKLNSCSCETDRGGWILDLSPLDTAHLGRPAFTITNFTIGATFTFNPCSGFRCGDRFNTGVCRKTYSGIDLPIGIQNEVYFNEIYGSKDRIELVLEILIPQLQIHLKCLFAIRVPKVFLS